MLHPPQIRRPTRFCYDWPWKVVYHTSPNFPLLYSFAVSSTLCTLILSVDLSNMSLGSVKASDSQIPPTHSEKDVRYVNTCNSINLFCHWRYSLSVSLQKVGMFVLLIHHSTLASIQKFRSSFHSNVSAWSPKYQSAQATRAIINFSSPNLTTVSIGH